MIMQWILSSCALLVAVVLLGKIFGERISGGLRYAMWLVVLIRLLVPIQLFSYEALPSFKAEAREMADHIPMEAAVHITEEGDVFLSGTGTCIQMELDGGAEREKMDPAHFLGVVWTMGSVMVASVFALSNVSFGRRLKKTRIRTGMEYRIPVYLVEELSGPCLFGLLRPAIYVPSKVAEDRRALHHVLAHECAHFGQGDHIWSVLRCLVLAVHWWNPLVWWAVTLSKQDGELACDEGALRDLRYKNRRAYGETLLNLVTAPVRPGGILSCAIMLTDEKQKLKQRIRRIANKKGYYTSTSVAIALVVSLLGICSFAGPEAYAAASVGGLHYEVLWDLPHRPDLNHDGRAETLTLSYAETKTGSISYLLEVRQDGEVLWFATADTAQPGWNALFLTEVDGRDYLLDIDSRVSGGQGDYSYSLSYLNNHGGRQVSDHMRTAFDINFDTLEHGAVGLFDPAAIAAVADQINDYLADSCQLLNTDENLLTTFVRHGYLVDDLWWLDEIDGFTRDESLTLEENLWACFDQHIDGDHDQPSGTYTEKKRPSVRAQAVVEVILTAPNPDLQYVIGGGGVGNSWAVSHNRQVTRNWDMALRRYIAWDDWQGAGKGRVYDKDRRVIYHQLNQFQVAAATSGDVYEVLDMEVLSREEGREVLDVAYAVNGEERHVKMTFYGAVLFTRIDIEPME